MAARRLALRALTAAAPLLGGGGAGLLSRPQRPRACGLQGAACSGAASRGIRAGQPSKGGEAAASGGGGGGGDEAPAPSGGDEAPAPSGGEKEEAPAPSSGGVSGFPSHSMLNMPALSPTMEPGKREVQTEHN